jgi:hypothetical protein
MLRRTTFVAALAAGLAALAGFGPAAKAPSDHCTAHQPHRGSGKGKGRIGARKPFHAPRHTRRDTGKRARRRRRAAALRRG